VPKPQSTLNNKDNLHVAIIMDGNGRWAQLRGLPRTSGHLEGAKAVRRVIECAPQFGISTLTLFAFSSDNWRRPEHEVATLMKLLQDYLQQEMHRCLAHDVRINVIGRRDRLPSSLTKAIECAETLTIACKTLHLRLAVDYSARHAIATAAATMKRTDACGTQSFAQTLNLVMHSNPPAKDVDLLIRTSGEQRLSDYLLWECAYAELWFCSTHWPDFAASHLERALASYHVRERRFGAIAV